MKGALAWLFGPGRPLLILALLSGMFGGGAYWGWLKHKDADSRPRPNIALTAEQVEITPLPEWIHSDVREEVFRDPALGGPLSIMDDDLVERIAKAFARASVGGQGRRSQASSEVV